MNLPNPNDLLTGSDRVSSDYRRDQYDRPLILMPDGQRIGYTRSSSAAKTVDDTYNLELWARRNVAYGLAHDRSLVARVLAIGGVPREWEQDEKQAVNAIVQDAAKIARAHEGADVGTALHELTHKLDRGESVRGGPYADDLDAYAQTLEAYGLTVRPEWTECKIVCDDLRMAGTADRLYTVAPSTWLANLLELEPGQVVVGDLKTGETVTYGALGWAAQLAAYAHGTLYDPANETRLETPPINRRHGIIVHLPAGAGRCDLYLTDLEAGYRAAELANEIRATRKAAKGWLARLELPAGQRPDNPDHEDDSEQDPYESRHAPIVPAALIGETVAQLRVRFGKAVELGRLTAVAWPDNIPKFRDGGPRTWAETLDLERFVMDLERTAGAEFSPRLPSDPLAPAPAPRHPRPAPAPPSPVPAKLTTEEIGRLKVLYNGWPTDLKARARAELEAAGIPLDQRRWRDKHREDLFDIFYTIAGTTPT